MSDRTVKILTEHQWDHHTQGCACGWSQRQVLPSGQARLNHPVHVAAALAEARHPDTHPAHDCPGDTDK